MFTIEHTFDASLITLMDEGPAPLQEDVVITALEDCTVIEQQEPGSDRVHRIVLSPLQLQDLAAAVNLPEGIYRRVRDRGK